MPRVKSRKPKLQDRPSARTLLLRRLRKSGRPAMIAAAVVLAIVIVPLGVRGIAGLYGPLHRAAAAALAWGGFRVEHVEIMGNGGVPRAEIEQALDVNPGTPILDVSPAAAARRIVALGAVRSAVVERLLPDTIRVRIAERRPIAIWQAPDGRFALIGADGSVLAGRDAGAARAHDPNLKLLVGAGAPAHAAALLALLRQYPDVAKRVAAAERIDDLRWNLILRDHATVQLPDRHAAAAMAVLMRAEARIRLLERPVRSIDLRLADRLVVRPYPKGFMADADAPKTAPDPGPKGHKS